MNRNAIALDMEASAFIQLCGHFGNDYAKCLGVVKGISDFGNSNKGKDENTPTEALKNTASALREWITHRIPVVSWVIDESKSQLTHRMYFFLISQATNLEQRLSLATTRTL